MVLDDERIDACAAAFTTLGRLHLEAPDDATLAVLWSMLADWPLPDTDDAAEGLRRWARSRDAREDAATIARDHNRLYGVSAKALVAPFESVHRDDDGLVFDTSTLAVREAYRDRGLRAPRFNREPDDHVGLEFDFVGRLALRALDALERDDPAAAEGEVAAAGEFLSAHLLQWAPGMLRTASDAAGTHFMAGLALLSLGALESAREDLAPDA
ncbi:MAG: molecular chaperone TorD family protein [Propionibacteriaceae bacterium]|nr:molecular chaperone TorD family protein [Propionibacteriaceae bacterium]